MFFLHYFMAFCELQAGGGGRRKCFPPLLPPLSPACFPPCTTYVCVALSGRENSYISSSCAAGGQRRGGSINKKISFFLRRRFGKAEEVRIVDRPTSEREGGRVKKGASTVRTRNETRFPEEDEIIISPPFSCQEPLFFLLFQGLACHLLPPPPRVYGRANMKNCSSFSLLVSGTDRGGGGPSLTYKRGPHDERRKEGRRRLFSRFSMPPPLPPN